jgi:hypothetical protein
MYYGDAFNWEKEPRFLNLSESDYNIDSNTLGSRIVNRVLNIYSHYRAQRMILYFFSITFLDYLGAPGYSNHCYEKLTRKITIEADGTYTEVVTE